MVGVWLDDTHHTSPCDENGAWLRSQADSGFENLAVIDVVGLTHAKTLTFKDALEAGHSRLVNCVSFNMALDVHACRNEGIQPIPVPDIATKKVKLDVIETGETDYLLPEIDESRHRFVQIGGKKPEDRIDHWERCLLDLNMSNRLINLPFGKSGLQLVVPEPQEFIDALQGKEKMQLDFSPQIAIPSNKKSGILEFDPRLTHSLVEDGYRRNTLYYVDRSGKDGQDYLKSLARRSNTSLEETGCNPLFLTLGLICWYENEKSAAVGTGALYAPIFLLPIKMPRRKTGNLYTFEYSFDDIQLNTTIFEYFRQAFNLNFNGLTIESISEDFGEGKTRINVQMAFNTIKRIIAAAGLKNWQVRESPSVLGLFSFAHFVMWSDIQTRRKDLQNHPIVRSFIEGGRISTLQGEEIKIEQFDDVVPPTSMAIPLPADSSQIKAIYDAEQGESFILDGPPGTGKSQTIANMIVDLLYHGKKVLFVAEKEVALDVVKNRLKDLGLGDFCLQIANMNTAKSVVLSQLGRLLELGPKEADGKKYAQIADAILEKRNELNGILKAIHGDSGFFISIYDAILLSLYHKDGAHGHRIDISEEYARNLTRESHQEAVSALEQIKVHDRQVGGYARSPYRAYLNGDYSIVKRDNLLKVLPKLEELLGTMSLAISTISSKHPMFAETLQNAKLLTEIFHEFEKESNLFFEYLGDKNVLAIQANILDKLTRLKNYYLLRENIEKDWKLEVCEKAKDSAMFAAKISYAQGLSFFKKHRAMSKLRKEYSSYAKNKTALKDNGLIELSSNLKQLHSASSTLSFATIEERQADRIIAAHSPRTAADFDALIKKFSKTFLVSELVKQLNPAKGHDFSEVSNFFSTYFRSDQQIFDPDFVRMVNSYEQLMDYGEMLKDDYDFDFERYFDDPSYNFFQYAKSCVRTISGDKGRLVYWCNLQGDVLKAKKVVPSELIEDYEKGVFDAEDLVDIFEHSLGNTIATIAVDEKKIGDRSLGRVDSSDTTRDINQYKKYVRDFARLTVEETFARITSCYPDMSSPMAPSTKLANLKKICAGSFRGFPLRKILDDFADIILKLCPCFLMSPVTVAQYLNAEKHQFDVVIFDEASQIPTAEAVGSISRGKSCIIAGDKNQMPPSMFFKTSINGPTDGDDVSFVLGSDLESLLEDAEALGFPKRSLNWHYRSRHESLIAFSNRRFYGNTLLTFPSPGEESSAVSFRYVKGTYSNNRNQEEAKAIVKEVIRRLKDPELSKHSIGIVTFNEPQQNLIEDYLERFLASNNLTNALPGGESIFVKNLENVQGDERDCIFFSITYAPDRKTGKMSINFGPLTQQEKGARRLNVAVSRAREEMIVFSSVYAEEIPAERATYDGARRLKEFLSFAQRGISALPYLSRGKIRAEVPSIANFLADELRNKGFSVDTNVGASTFKIDVAIHDPRFGDRYILGIILDGDSYTNTPTCRDRNIVQPEILKNLGWKIYRMWSVEFFDHPDSCLNQIVEAINHAINSQREEEDKNEEEDKTSLNLVSKKVERNRHAITYVFSEITPRPFVENEKEKQNLSLFLREVIAKEAPISEETLKERFKARYQIDRMTANIRGFFQEALQTCLPYVYIEFCGSYRFYWPDSGLCYSYSFYRLPAKGESRDVCDISYIELGNAMRDILHDQGKMLASDLYKQVSLLFGNEKLIKKASDYLGNALKANQGGRLGIKIDADMTVSLLR